MSRRRVETRYEIKEVSPDGLLKTPKEKSGYGYIDNLFDPSYTSLEAVDAAILKDGEEYTDYIVLTVKRVIEDAEQDPAHWDDEP